MLRFTAFLLRLEKEMVRVMFPRGRLGSEDRVPELGRRSPDKNAYRARRIINQTLLARGVSLLRGN